MAPTRVILMSCGSYNPPTNMHLRMFEIARDHLHRMGTHVVVGGVISPVHDAYAKKELASATHRCSMLRLALQNSDWIRLSTWETKQNCWTKTRLCLQHHQNLLNSILSNSNDIKHHMQIEDTEWIPENVKNNLDNTPIQIKLLCGADLLESFGICGLWLEEDIDAIVGEHGLVVITREGSNPNKFIYDSDILSKHMHNICIVTEWIPNEVSSTRIRRALKRSESVRYLLQDSVIDYIYKQEIYDARISDTTTIDVIMDSPSPIEITASIDMPDAVVLRKNLQNAGSGDGGGLDEIREQFISVISHSIDNGNVKQVTRAAYPGQAKQVIASETGVARILDEVGLLDEPELQPGPSSEEGYRSTVDRIDIGRRKVLDFKSKTEIVNVGLSSNDNREIIMKVQSGQSGPIEMASKDVYISTLEKDNIDFKTLNLISKTEIANVDLGSNDDHEIMMKIQTSQSSSSEIRLGECCWPKRESIVDDKIVVCDRNITSEREIIDIELGLDNKSTLALKERRRSAAEAINDEVGSDRSISSKSQPEKIPRSTVKSVAKGQANISDKDISVKKEIDELDIIDDVVKVQPAYSSHSIITLKDDRRLMIEKLTNELKIKLDEEKNKSKESSQIDKFTKDNIDITKFNLDITMKDNADEVDDAEINSKKEIGDSESDKVKQLEATTTISSLDISMTSLDGRHECALSDFGVDKEDYRLSQYGSDEDGETEKLVYTARSSWTKYDDQAEDTTDSITDIVSDDKTSAKKSDVQSHSGQVLVSAMIHEGDKEECFTPAEIDDRTKSSGESDRSKFIAKGTLSKMDGRINIENGEEMEEVFRISLGIDEVNTSDKGLEFDAHPSDKRTTSYDPNLEIDGKYLKSIVNSRKSPRKIREGQIHDVEYKEQQRLIDDQSTLQSEVFQGSSTKAKSSAIKKEHVYGANSDIKEKAFTVKDRETSRAERGSYQDPSRSTSLKTKSPRKIKELQFDKSEFKDPDKSLSDRETSRSGKASKRSSRISASTKSPNKSKKSQVYYRGDELKDYNRSIKDRVISQLEEVFHGSSKKSATKAENSKRDSKNIESRKQDQSGDNQMLRTERFSQHSSRTSSTKSPKRGQDQKTVRMIDSKDQEAMKMSKNAESKAKCDFKEIKDVYTRKVRRYNVPLQGSLDSMIVSDETSAQKPKKDDAFSKKSKSYESIKRIQEVFLGVPPTKANSSASQLDIPDEFCSICCYMNEITFRTEEEVSSPNQETFYTLRSACSSLADDDEDSIECDICSSLNLQESIDDLEGKEIPCELCQICGEVDGSYQDQDAALPADRYFKIVHPRQDDDESFEIENCGFQSGTESADDRRLSDKERVKMPERPKSQSLFIHGSSMSRDQPRELYFIPKDEIAILTSGARRIGRKGSLFKKKEDLGVYARDNRRYSSVDSLQLAKMASKTSDKTLEVTKKPTMGSADNLLSTDSRRSKCEDQDLQRSSGDMKRLSSSTDNLASLTEKLGKENEAGGSGQGLNIQDKEAVKMILTQHGIKIISEKETSL